MSSTKAFDHIALLEGAPSTSHLADQILTGDDDALKRLTRERALGGSLLGPLDDVLDLPATDLSDPFGQLLCHRVDIEVHGLVAEEDREQTLPLLQSGERDLDLVGESLANGLVDPVSMIRRGQEEYVPIGLLRAVEL
jgi:hypothetical protein